jgi:hypothetical protein
MVTDSLLLATRLTITVGSKLRYVTPFTCLCCYVAGLSSPAEVVFLVDTSTTSFTPNDFSNVKAGLISLVNSMAVSANFVHVSLVTFSSTQTAEFLLNSPTASNFQSITSYIQGLNQRGDGGNDYSAALRFVADTVLSPSNVGRKYTPINVYVIAGTQSDNNANTLQAANYLKSSANLGAHSLWVIPVGITNTGSGTQVNQVEMQQIATTYTSATFLTSAAALSQQAATISALASQAYQTKCELIKLHATTTKRN